MSEGITFDAWINDCIRTEIPSGLRADIEKWMADNIIIIMDKHKELEGL